ncbi:DUF4390 domain-containing protein [Usitatibacter palustris]|uniref:DUF4390 domain-containing protein n=1 Tax=Usitatibacter palustris TaxID=2732487 RepID=A0A6M4H5P2_9PROT|nr:DUF4390 domain-containing protein [Usitatibacter palustris]QJR13227.1 hypothetical protein DSM104440_00009 [Usitatibacter palustris]
MRNATALTIHSRLAAGTLQAARLWMALAALMVALCLPMGVHAEGISITKATVEPGVDGWQLDAEFDMQFSPRLEEAVTRGVPLYFVVEFELSRPRWYWFDEKPVRLSQTYKISYTPLLRQYRLSVGTLYQNFTRFDEVKRVLARTRAWHVADKGALAKDVAYQANLRMRLDTAQLPKPFQLNALASSDWTLASEWHRWTVTP